MREGTWYDEAACAGQDTETFFPEATAAAHGAYNDFHDMCGSCPVAKFCRIASFGESSGYWAGLTASQRNNVRSYWGVSDDYGTLAAEGHRVAARAWTLEVPPAVAAGDWLGETVGAAVLDWYAPMLTKPEYREFYGARQSA